MTYEKGYVDGRGHTHKAYATAVAEVEDVVQSRFASEPHHLKWLGYELQGILLRASMILSETKKESGIKGK